MNDKKTAHRFEYKVYLRGARQLVEQSQWEKKPYRVHVLGREYIVYPTVFSPKYFHGTEVFGQHLPVRPGEDMLEIGSGIGVISITAVYRGAKRVVATDIHLDAVKNTQANIKKHHLEDRIEVRQGDVYAPLPADERFDTIFWNPPMFSRVKENAFSDLEKAIYDPGHASLERFIKEAKEHLNQGGKLVVGFSPTLGEREVIEQFAREAGLALSLLYEVENEIHGVKFEILQATPAHIAPGRMISL